jgi:hypothetical protein
MERTRKTTVAGILCIILGAVFLIPSIVLLIGSYYMTVYVPLTTVPSYVLWGALVIIPGIMPIVGGIYALRRRRWGLALAGSIFTLLNCVILGICGIIGFIFVFLGYVDNPGAHFDLSDFTSLGIGLIVGLTIFGILGLLALILVIRGKGEFK